MFLIVGLGNPGEKYAKTRHNSGFILLNEVVSSFEKDKYASVLLAKEVFGGKEAVLVKPETFMNESGRAVLAIMERFGIPSENVLVIYDDIDLPMGDLRISFDRGDGGHNGIKSVAAALGTRGFTRLRVGIAPRGEDGRAIKPKGGFFTSQSRAVSNFVLKDFSASDLEKMKSLAPKVKKIIETFVKEGREKAMNEFN